MLVTVWTLGGCSIMGGTFAKARTSSGEGAGVLALDPGTFAAVYRRTDLNTADIYLTDLALDRLTETGKRASPLGSGSVVHINLFISPRAGRTPVDDTACNVTIRMLVIPDGSRELAGLYVGGGFALPRGSIGDDTLGASIRGASLRFLRGGPGFQDLLGAAEFDARFSAPRDDALAAKVRDWFENTAAALPHAP